MTDRSRLIFRKYVVDANAIRMTAWVDSGSVVFRLWLLAGVFIFARPGALPGLVR